MCASISNTRSRRSRRFTPLTRQLSLQHHACGFGYKKISKVTGIPISTIKYHVRKERGGDGGRQGTGAGADGELESADASVAGADNAASPAPDATAEAPDPVHNDLQAHPLDSERSVALVAMMQAVHDSLKKNVYAFARALQHDSHGAAGIMRAADPQILMLALDLLLGDPWRLVLSGKCAHQARCLKKCKLVLTHEQLAAARTAAAAAVAQSSSPDELKVLLKLALAPRADDKCQQVRFLQLAVATNTALQQALEAAPRALLESRELWRVLHAGPNPTVPALALVSLALALQSGGDVRDLALVRLRAPQLADQLHGSVSAVEAFLSRSMAGGRVLSADVIMAQLGVYDLAATKEASLILRDEELEVLDERCARALTALEILSLSHNRLASIEHFEHFTNLIELNLNFNSIASLANLQCTGLEKLFVANNKIADIAPLREFQKLNTLSLYGNVITDLDAALHTCRAFPKLRSLDLGGNPCSRETEGYKFKVVRVLPRLKKLDGDQITQLDKDLAEDFAVHGSTKTQSAARSNGGFRPFTAPAGGANDRLRNSRWDAPTPKAYDPFSSKDMPRGNVRLFRDDFLNNNPILLEYLVEDAHEVSPLGGMGVVGQTRAKFQGHDSDNREQIDADRAAGPVSSSSASAGFVGKMRTANPLRSAGTTNDSADDSAAPGGTESAALERPTTAISSSGSSVQTSHFSIDPSDPKATTRKLLKHIEILMETISSQKNRQMDACSDALVEENKRLQIENNNIPILLEQIGELKKQLAAVGGGARGSTADVKRSKELEHENAALKRKNARLKQSLVAMMNGNPDEPLIHTESPRAAHDESRRDGSQQPKRLGTSELLDESASIDVELTELILQNEVSLELIRNEIKSTKKEWEVQLQQAKQRERARVRPSTSLGLPSSYELSKPGEILAAASSQTTRTGSSSGKGGARPRQLHTSTGFRNGPEEHLLRQAAVQSFGTASARAQATHPLTPSSSSSRRLTADILTL
ncbi:hypothetical protein PybrP1_011345 [[Pythium] brassicae (nom. inval.)]|nr:hypothetical protein PybrP1_011345 [[Pythium] brassicae (nom. inval.)]